ncbi:MAG: CHAT domain-containing protein [Gemmatimonadaceae bacterium]
MPNLAPDSAPQAMHFAEFALRAWRDDPSHVQVIAHATPVGAMRRPVTVKLSRVRRRDFDMGVDDTLAHAAELGRELSRILLPEAVLALLMESIRYTAQRSDMGLRLRLCLDDELIDLPWECLYRPDLTGPARLDGFFLADGDLSLVREAASLPFTPAPTERAQRALFLGTLFDDQEDYWFTRDEFKALQANTADIADRLAFEFLPTGDTAAVEQALAGRFDIFHYAGHVEAEQAPAYFIQTAHYDPAQQPGFSEADGVPAAWTRADRLAPLLQSAGVKLAVFNACNSGHWTFMQPLMAHGLPAAIGVQGTVLNDAALAFSSALYSALAVGLSLDEAVTRARLTVLRVALPDVGKHPSQRQVFTSANDWLRFMVYLPTQEAVLFPRPATKANVAAQRRARRGRVDEMDTLYAQLALLNGSQRASVISRIARSQVFILGRFDAAHKPTLDALRDALAAHHDRYAPMVFDFDKPTERNLTEAVRTYALTSRFVIADISAPRCVPHELMAIVPNSPSIPVVPILREGEEPYAMFNDLLAYPWVLPPVRYRDDADLIARLQTEVIAPAEKRLTPGDSRE